MICSCFRLQCPSSIFIYTPEEELLERPALSQHHSVAGTSCSPWTRRVCTAPLTCSGGVLGSPLCAWALHCPCAHAPAATSKEQGRARRGEEAGRGLFSTVLSFSSTPLWVAVEEKISYQLISHPGVKQLFIFQSLNGENHPSCSCLQGQSALFVPWMLNTRFIKVMLFLRTAMEMSQSLFLLSDI